MKPLANTESVIICPLQVPNPLATAVPNINLSSLRDNLTLKDGMNPYADYTAEQMYDFLSSFTLERDIGSSTQYSNLGQGLLGHILSLKASVSYEQLVVNQICNGLKMDSTQITLSPQRKMHLAKGYMGKTETPNWDFIALAGASALRSSVRDLVKFLAASPGFSKTELYRVMQNTHKARHETDDLHTEIALGWHIFTKHDTEIIEHNGETGGFHCAIGFNPEKKTGVVVLYQFEK